MKIAEDGRYRPTEGVNLSGDRKIRNCNRIALRRISLRASAEGASGIFPSISQAKGQSIAKTQPLSKGGFFVFCIYTERKRFCLRFVFLCNGFSVI